MKRLKVLQGQKDAIGDEVSASLQKRVSPKALNVIRSLVLPYIKSKDKNYPRPENAARRAGVAASGRPPPTQKRQLTPASLLEGENHYAHQK